MTAGDRLDGDAERLPGLGQPFAPVAEVAQHRSPEPLAGKLTEHRDDALGVVDIRRRDVDRQRDAVLVHAEMDRKAQPCGVVR